MEFGHVEVASIHRHLGEAEMEFDDLAGWRFAAERFRSGKPSFKGRVGVARVTGAQGIEAAGKVIGRRRRGHEGLWLERIGVGECAVREVSGQGWRADVRKGGHHPRPLLYE
jgi:hypothetical protein